MSLEMRSVFDNVERVVKSGVSVREGLEELLRFYQQNLPSSVWGKIRYLDFEQDVQSLKAWLEGVLSTEPPGNEIAAFWFGLFNPTHDDTPVSNALYVCGSEQFDPEDETGDWAASPSYFPNGRYAESVILHQIYRMVQGDDKELAWMGEFGLCLGYAALAVSELCRTIDRKLLLGDRESRGIAVGWDSGDFLLLPTIFRSH